MLTKYALRRPVAIIVSLIALFIFGFSSLVSTPLELAPSMSMPMLIISTVYPGAGPEEVESLVTGKVEGAVGNLAGLKTVQSISAENSSMIMIELEYGTDMNTANTEVQKKLNMILSSLPSEAMDPIVIEMKMDSTPVVQMSALALGDMDLLSYLDENIVPEFEKLPGVAQVTVQGGQEKYMQVRLSPEKMRQYNLDMNTVSQLVGSADFSLPAGKLEQGELALSLRGGVSYPSPEALRRLPITLKTGDIIHLSDVAEVGPAQQDATSISRYDGSDRVSIAVTKRDSASTKDVTDGVVKTLEGINEQSRDIELAVTFNSSDEIWASLVGVIQAMAFAIVISMVILFLFLGDIRASLIVGTSMPISVLVTLILMSATGMTFNMLSLGGLTIGVGMMVDNSIVVLDSCFKKRDEHRSFYDAAVEGAGVVASAVTASTITTVVVFLPISLMKGISGQMFRDAGFTIVYALTASLVSAITLVPLLFLHLKPRERKTTIISRGLRRFEQGYARLIRTLLNHRVVVIMTAVLMLIASFIMLPAIGVELMPSSDSGTISVSISTRPGLRLPKIETLLSQVEEIIVRQPDVEHYSMSGSSGANAFSSASSGNASFSINLKKDRTTATADIVDILRQETKNIPGCDIKISSSSGMSLGGGTDQVQDFLIGNDRETLTEASEGIKEVMAKVPGIVSVATSTADGSPQAEIMVDSVKAGAMGFSPMQVMSSVSAAVSGKEAATIRMDGYDYKVRVEYPKGTYQKISDLAGLTLLSPSGRQTPLLDIATIKYSNSPQQIMRYNNQYVVSITGQAQSQNAAKISADATKAVNAATLPNGVSHFFGGSIQTMNEEFSAIFTSMATAVFLVFMVMSIQFNSLGFALMVMISVPFSLIGAFAGLLLTGTTISMTSLMGMILLVGIVVNNAIVLIDYTNQLRDGGMKAKNALIKAGRTRLRPILMTTLTTVLGMVPMAIGMGDNAEMMRGMAMVVIGGLTTSTLLTLILIPTFYLMFSKKDAKNPNLQDDDRFDPEKPQAELYAGLPDDMNQSEPALELEPSL